MNNLLQINSAAFWILIGVLVVLFIGIAIFNFINVGRMKRNILQGFEFISEQSERLRIEQQMNISKQAKEFSELTGITTDRKLEELDGMYEKAVKDKETEKAQQIIAKKAEIQQLRANLLDAADQKEKLENKLRNNVIASGPALGLSALKLFTGGILLVRHQGKYGAVQAVEQASGERGSFIRYVWWYQPDGTGSFTNANTLQGFGETGETMGSQLEIGPIKLSWSKCEEGSGWIYFGPTIMPSPEYELVIAGEIDIAKINAINYLFNKYEPVEE